MQIDAMRGWKINDQHPEWPWCAVNIQTGEVRGPFDSWHDALKKIQHAECQSDKERYIHPLEPFDEYNYWLIEGVDTIHLTRPIDEPYETCPINFAITLIEQRGGQRGKDFIITPFAGNRAIALHTTTKFLSMNDIQIVINYSNLAKGLSDIKNPAKPRSFEERMFKILSEEEK